MKPGKRLKIKVCGFIVQPNETGEPTLLVYLNVLGVPFRLVGGNVDPGETLEEALFREIEEESGLSRFTSVRKLGVQTYYKEFIDANVERHDYLLVPEKKLPEHWEHVGHGQGGDQGTLFKYQWIGRNEIQFLHHEFKETITEAYIQQLFDRS